jgi:DNA repair protein RecN (Recombination protein N)
VNAVLLELSIRNFAIIDELTMEFGPGFSVLTGETGAGKSIIIDGLDLLLGGRADSTMVRTGARRAQIEGVFAVPNSENRLAALLEREQLNGDDVDRLVLAREVRSTGRSSSRVNGHIVNLRLLRRITAGLVDIHGQSEHLSLMRVREHIYLLDRYAGLEGEREKVSGLVRQLYEVRSELSQLLHDERELARKVDLLTYQIDEIRNAALQPGEEESLQEERTRLANAEQLAALADEAYTYLEGQIDEMPAIQDLLGQTVRALAGLAKIDASQATLQQAAEQVSFQVDDLSHLLRDYREQIEFNPGRLAAVEERIELIRRLQRKYGDSIEDVLAYAKSAAAELEAISHSEERMAELEEQEDRLLREIGRLASALSGERRAAATRMAAAVEQELADLRMTGARFGVDISWRPDPDGAVIPSTASDGESGQAERIAFDASGLDRVEFLISPNPGEPLKPMVKIASGGETSRLMLAIKTVLSRADQTPTLVFDEIDQGIGGRVGQTVGQKLWGLSQGLQPGRQVICVTHLPQLAGFGDAHYRVEKQVIEGRTVTRVQELDLLDNRVGEIALMMGGETPATRDSAREILDQVQQHKGAR